MPRLFIQGLKHLAKTGYLELTATERMMNLVCILYLYIKLIVAVLVLSYVLVSFVLSFGLNGPVLHFIYRQFCNG